MKTLQSRMTNSAATATSTVIGPFLMRGQQQQTQQVNNNNNNNNNAGFSRRHVRLAFLFGLVIGLTMSSVIVSLLFLLNDNDNNNNNNNGDKNGQSTSFISNNHLLAKKEESSFLPPLTIRALHREGEVEEQQPVNDDSLLDQESYFNFTTILLSQSDVLEFNHFIRAWQQQKIIHDDNDSFFIQSIPPFQVLKTYIQQHSHQQLRREWLYCQQEERNDKQLSTSSSSRSHSHSHSYCTTLQNRKYVVGVYSCPLEAGNRIHRFVNSLLWAVLTNRTLLIRYHTMDVCRDYERAYPNEDCSKVSNTSAPFDCHHILHVSPWIPRFDDWKERLELIDVPIVRAEIRRTNKETSMDSTTLPFDSECSPKLIRPGKQVIVNPGDVLTEPTVTTTTPTRHLIQPANLERLRNFQAFGAYFAYGMMQDALFTLDPSLFPPKKEDRKVVQNSYFLHSRHPSPKDNGEYIWPEYMCLTNIFSPQQQDQTQTATDAMPLSANNPNHTVDTSIHKNDDNDNPLCVIYLLSDREVSLTLLTDAIHNVTHHHLDCQVQTTQEKAMGESFFSVEHGPFAGRGFWQDIAMATQARRGMIAFHKRMGRSYVRTSSSLIRERVEFRRVMESIMKTATTTTTTMTSMSDKTVGTIVSEINNNNNNNSSSSTTNTIIEPFLECTNPWKKK